MKRLTAALLAACTAAASMMLPVSADTPKLPFALEPPESVFVRYRGGSSPESLNSCVVFISPNRQYDEWGQHDGNAAELKACGYSDLTIRSQLDWSIDSQDDWHYNAFWDTDGFDDAGVMRFGSWESTINAGSGMRIFDFMGDISDPGDSRWYGGQGTYTQLEDPAFWDPAAWEDRGEDRFGITGKEYAYDYVGWKDLLKPEQYQEIEIDGQRCAKIDFTEHTAYVRVCCPADRCRYLCCLRVHYHHEEKQET